MPEEVDACYDEQDERVWDDEDVFWSIDEIKMPIQKAFYPKTINNQRLDPVMRMSCTRQSPVHIINAQNRYVADETHTTLK